MAIECPSFFDPYILTEYVHLASSADQSENSNPTEVRSAKANKRRSLAPPMPHRPQSSFRKTEE
jgi:hypothetical protein